MIFKGPFPPKPLYDSVPDGVLTPSAAAPGWAPQRDRGHGSFLALSGAVGEPSYQPLALLTEVRLCGPMPCQGGHCLCCVQLLAV